MNLPSSVRFWLRRVLGPLWAGGLLGAVAMVQAAEPQRREWTVEGVVREGLVYAPETARTQAAPLVFVFHGHGGSMHQVARSFSLHTHWPEAVVVYLQGLNTPGRLTDPEGRKPGWQAGAGAQGDRDLKLFDRVLGALREEDRIDDRRIYATGHSNGGGFTYLLWSERGDVFAALAPSAAAARLVQNRLAPKPILHIAGEKDALVKFAWQQETMALVRRLNRCGEGQPWAPRSILYPSPVAAPVVTLIHPGAHGFPREAPPLIVKFFREHAKP